MDIEKLIEKFSERKDTFQDNEIQSDNSSKILLYADTRSDMFLKGEFNEAADEGLAPYPTYTFVMLCPRCKHKAGPELFDNKSKSDYKCPRCGLRFFIENNCFSDR